MACALDLRLSSEEPRESMTTGKSHSLDPATLALESLTKPSMLGGFSGAIEPFDDYQGAP